MSFHVSLSCFLSLDSIRVRPVQCRAKEVEEINQAEMETIQAWQEALMRQWEARCWIRARQFPIPAICVDYYNKKHEKARKREEEEHKLKEKEPFVTISPRLKTPVESWFFQSMLWAELQKERKLEDWVQHTGLFEPLRIARPRKDFMQIYHKLKEKYVVVDTKI